MLNNNAWNYLIVLETINSNTWNHSAVQRSELGIVKKWRYLKKNICI